MQESAKARSDIESCRMASGTHRPTYYKTQGKFVERNYPYGDQARFRKRLPSLRDIFRALGGHDTKDAFDKLVQQKADPDELYDLLRAVGVSSDEPIQWTRRERRTTEQLSSKCEKLAVEIEHAREKWPFGASMMYSDFMKWEELPQVLRSYAEAWKKELAHPFRCARSPRNENIVRLVRYVKDKTGDYRYQQVADLLNATDEAYGWETRLCGATGLRIGEALGIRVEKILDNGARIIIDEKAWRGEIHDYLKNDNGEREIDLPENVAKLLVEFIGGREKGLLFCTRKGTQLSQSNILRRDLHPALREVGFEKAGNHAFRRYRNTFLRNYTHCPDSVRNFWLGWSEEGMSGLYDRIKADVAFRRVEANRCGVGFDVPATLGSIEPNEPKIDAAIQEEVAVNA